MMNLSERIRKYLEKCAPAISGQRGHDTTFRVASALVNGFALPEYEALRYLQIYNQRCLPPWKEKELKYKITQASRVPHKKPRGYLKKSFEPIPIKIVPIAETLKIKVGLLPPNNVSRTVRIVVSNPLPIYQKVTCSHVMTFKHPSEVSETPLASRIPPGLCPICWDHAGKYIPLNEAGVCPRASTFWHVKYAP